MGITILATKKPRTGGAFLILYQQLLREQVEHLGDVVEFLVVGQ